MGWTHRLAPDDLADLAGFNVTCHQVQDWGDKAHECRVVVVDDRMFAVAIHAGSPESYVDWRISGLPITETLVALLATGGNR
jgi:hypothetical protein